MIIFFFLISGSNGINGQDPPIPQNSSTAAFFWDSLQYFHNITYNETTSDEDSGILHVNVMLQVYGRNGTYPRRGGHGGVGGLGGHAGKVFIVGLQQEHNFTIYNKTGKKMETL